LADEADDHRLRSLMSETPLADREFRDAQRHATHVAPPHDVVEAIERLEVRQDELLDALTTPAVDRSERFDEVLEWTAPQSGGTG